MAVSQLLFTTNHLSLDYLLIFSFIPFSFKRGLILLLLHCFFNICSNYENFHEVLETFKKILRLNGYPGHFFDGSISVFQIMFPPSNFWCMQLLKMFFFFCLPFTGIHSLQIRKQISSVFASASPHLNIRFIFRPTRRLSHIFTFKDRVPKGLRSRVVYSFKCQFCSALYVGQTACHLHTRVSDHLGVSVLTVKKRSTAFPSSILAHLSETGHTASLDDFKILFTCSSPSKLLVREGLPVSEVKPSLNGNLSSIPLSLF